MLDIANQTKVYSISDMMSDFALFSLILNVPILLIMDIGVSAHLCFSPPSWSSSGGPIKSITTRREGSPESAFAGTCEFLHTVTRSWFSAGTR
jgi:hypothetical protein